MGEWYIDLISASEPLQDDTSRAASEAAQQQQQAMVVTTTDDDETTVHSHVSMCTLLLDIKEGEDAAL